MTDTHRHCCHTHSPAHTLIGTVATHTHRHTHSPAHTLTGTHTHRHCCCEVAVGKLRRRIIDVQQLDGHLSRTCQSWYSSVHSDDLQTIHRRLKQMPTMTVLITHSLSDTLPSHQSTALYFTTTTTTTVLRPFFRDHPGEPVPEENVWTLWCKGRLTEADTLTIRLGATPSALTSDHHVSPMHKYLFRKVSKSLNRSNLSSISAVIL